MDYDVSLRVLRACTNACHSALAFKLRQLVVIEPDGFVDQQRIAFSILFDGNDFKVRV